MMKYLLVLVVVLVAFFVWHHKRAARLRAQAQRPIPPRPPASAPTGTPQTIVTCCHCGVHLPSQEAVAGHLGPYCGPEHRRLAEG